VVWKSLLYDAAFSAEPSGRQPDNVQGVEMKSVSSFKLKALLCALLFGFSSVAGAMVLTFEATYLSKSTISGPAFVPDTSFSPTSFQFQVEFDTSITYLHNQLNNSTFDGPSGNPIHYTFSVNQTSFGVPVFSSSPFSSELGSSISTYIDPHLYNWSSSSLSTFYNFYDSEIQSDGYRNMGFSTHYEFQPDNDYDFYAMAVGLTLANPPENLSEVRFASPQELISELELARDLGTEWHVNEIGIFHQGMPDRNGGNYDGTAKLVAINGIETNAPLPINPVPEPGGFALFITGLSLMGLVARRGRLDRGGYSRH
jgi:hypothetical protein